MIDKLICFAAGVVTALVAVIWEAMSDKRTTFYIDEDYRLHYTRVKGKRVKRGDTPSTF